MNNAGFSTIVTSITQDKFVPKVIDQVLDGNVLTMRLMGQSRTQSFGETFVIPVNMSAYTNLGSYAGFDTFGTAQQNTRQKANFYPSQMYCGVTLSGIQLAINQGDPAVLDLLATELDQRAKDFKDEFGNQVYGDGTGNNNKDILGLTAAVDDATSITTYGALSRDTYTNWKATRTAQSGSLSLADLAADFDAASVAGEVPTIAVTTPAIFSIYEALLTPTVSHQFSMNDFRMTGSGMAKVGGTLAANQGFRALTFRGIPVVADPKCTSGNLFTLNENHLNFYNLPQPSGRAVKSGFGWTGMKMPVNQDAEVGQFLWYGQLVCDSPRTQARRTGITS